MASPPSPPSTLIKDSGPNRGRTWLAYAVMLVAAVALYWVIRDQGNGLTAPPSGGKVVHATSAHSHVLAEVLLAIATIVLFARFVGHMFDKYLKQPPVMGEMVAGILLGPSVLGAISMPLYEFVLPPEAAPHLGIVAKIGVVLFMFLVGLELDLGVLRSTSHATMAISHASILAPFLLGATLALGLYPIYSHAGVSFTVFSLFLGVSMSVTAFPVLARILTDRRMHRSPLGMTALACAAVDDATAWCLLALVSGVATAQMQKPAVTFGLVVVYLVVMYFVARPLAKWLNARQENRSGQVTLTMQAMVIGMLLLSSVATEAIGIHALFGAFVAGALIPHEGKLAEMLRVRLDDVVVVLLLPIFFAFTGMRTKIGLLDGAGDWMFLGLIIAVATLGKFGGSYIAARFAGLSNRDSSALGILMNTRGLMELIVLNVGLDMGVLSPRLFAMFVLMALVTTFATTPILNLIARGQAYSEVPSPIQGADRPA